MSLVAEDGGPVPVAGMAASEEQQQLLRQATLLLRYRINLERRMAALVPPAPPSKPDQKGPSAPTDSGPI